MNTLQQAVYDSVIAGHNMCMTGPAGTGKSYVIRAIVKAFESMDMRCAVTAMTGSAAVLLECKARTLNSWAGIRLGELTAEKLVERVRSKRTSELRWKLTDLLIVDEVGMLTPELFRKLDYVARTIRGSNMPFGGMQVLFSCDFLQLPPILNDHRYGPRTTSTSEEPQFVFEDPLWARLFPTPANTIVLTAVLRQTDPAFVSALQELRFGTCSNTAWRYLQSLQRSIPEDMEIKPTVLYPGRQSVEQLNQVEIRKLGQPMVRFDARTSIPPTVPKTQTVYNVIDLFDKHAPYEVTTELCIGAQVMLLYNMDVEAGYVNGSRGVVTGFTPAGAPIVKFLAHPDDPQVIEYHTWEVSHPDYPGITRSQIPLRVAYALTIHKSQGASIDYLAIDFTNVFEYGQAYVALSRAKNPDMLYILGSLSRKYFRAHPRAVAYYEKLVAPPSDAAAAPAGAES
jgi:ATP-dependent DNA helicase PIF1